MSRLPSLALAFWAGFSSVAAAQDLTEVGGPRHQGAVMAASYSSDGKSVLSAGVDKTIRLWDAFDGRQTASWGAQDQVLAAAFSLDGSLVASGGGDAMPRVWSAKDGRLVAQLKSFWSAHSLPITTLAWTPGGETLLTGSVDSTIKIWSVPKAKLIATLQGHEAEMDNDRTTGTLCRWIPRSCREQPSGGKTCTPAHQKCSLGVMAIVVSADGQTVLTGGGDGAIKAWALPEGRLKVAWPGNGDPVLALAFSPDGRKVLSGSTSNVIRLWDSETGTVQAEWGGHTDDVTSVAFSPDGRSALSGSRDLTVKLWSVETGAAVKTWTGHQGEVRSVAFSLDGRRALSAGLDGAIKVWEVVEPEAVVETVEAPAVEEAEEAPPIAQAPPPAPAVKLPKLVAAPAVEEAEEAPPIAQAPPPAPAVKLPKPVAPPVAPPVVAPPVEEIVEAPPIAPPVVAAGRLSVANLSTEVVFAEPSGNDALDGGEKGILKVTVTNAGPGLAQDLRVAINPLAMPGVQAPAKSAFGDLAPGASTTIEVLLEAVDDVPSGQAKLELLVEEKNGFDSDAVIIEFETRAIPLARLELSAVSIGGGIVRLAEVMPMEVTVRNVGTATAKEVFAALIVADPEIVISGDPSFALGTIEPGQSRKADFEFFVKKRYKGPKKLPISVSLTEASGKRGVPEAALRLALGEIAPALKVVSIKGKAQTAAAPAADAAFEDVDSPPETPTPIDPDAYAVVIGIEKYRQDGVPSVDFAARDAQSVYNYLTRSMGFDSKNVALLQNARATRTDLVKYLGSWLKNRVTSAKSRVFIYYAGHGAPDPKGTETYLVPYDGDPSYTEDTAFPVKKLYAQLAQLPTKDITVALDACFSGAGGRSVIAAGARPLITAIAAPSVGENMVVLSATSADQISTYYPDGQHGLMTYFLLKGLKGAADADADGRITTAEIYGYVKDPVEREARKQNVEQVPGLSPAPDQLGERAGRVWLRLK